jgi:hypothetical protein
MKGVSMRRRNRKIPNTKEGNAMSATQNTQSNTRCGCAQAGPVVNETMSQSAGGVKLEDLIPIAVVIAAGCEPCSQRMVERALAQGSSRKHIQKVVGIVASMQKLECLADAVGPDVLARMEKPLAMARRTLANEAYERRVESQKR